MRQHLGADVGETLPAPDRSGCHVGTETQDWRVFAGMIGPLPTRVVAMIGGDDGKVAFTQSCLDFGHTPIEVLERRRISRDVAAVAVFAVEIDQIGEDESAIRQGFHGHNGSGQAGVVAMRLDLPTRAPMSENVADLADRDDGPAGFCKLIQDRVFWRLSGEILAVSGSYETGLSPSPRRDER